MGWSLPNVVVLIIAGSKEGHGGCVRTARFIVFWLTYYPVINSNQMKEEYLSWFWVAESSGWTFLFKYTANSSLEL